MNLTLELIEQLTFPEYYQRGLKYYLQGRVTSFEEKDDVIEAQVSGTEMYEVTIYLNSLTFECSCPIGDNEKPCKHIIAVLLTKVRGIKSPTAILQKKKRKLKKRQPSQELPIKNDNCTFEEVKKRIIQDFKIVSRNYGDYWKYVRAQDQFHGYLQEHLDLLPNNEETGKNVQKLVKWLDKKLDTYDDSDGVLQDCTTTVLLKSIKYLENSMDTSLLYEIVKTKYVYTDTIQVLELALEYIENPDVKRKIAEELEEKVFKELWKNVLQNSRAKIVTHETSYYIDILSKYYLNNEDTHPGRFEDFAKKFSKYSHRASGLLIDYYNEREQYEKVYLLWENGIDDNFHIYQKKIEKAINRIKDPNKQLKFWKTKVLEKNNYWGIEIRDVQKIKELLYRLKKGDEWLEIKAGLVKTYKNNVDLLMQLTEYDLALDALIGEWEKSGRSTPTPKEEITTYGVKFKAVSPKHAKRIYQYCFNKEFENIKKGSNSYDRFISYGENLIELGNKETVETVCKEIMNNFPTRKKLIERIESLLF